MRIGIACFPTSGGSGVVATELGLALAKRGHEVYLVSPARPFRLAAGERRVHFEPVSVPDYPLQAYPSYGIALACRLAEVAERRRLDVIHVHYAYPHAVSALLARDMLGERAPALVVTLHGTDITLAERHPCHERAVRFALDRSDHVTAVSDSLRQETLRRFGTQRVIAVIRNFVDPRVFAPRPRSSAGARRRYAPPGEALLVHVSNFRAVKRVPDLIRAFALLRRHVPARLLLVGDGEAAATARRLVARLGLSRSVRFLGEVRRVERLLPLADLFLLASEREGFGLSALEAMACGVPVVSTRSGGPEEILTDGLEGRLVPVGAPAAMARACRDLLGDPELRAAMGRRARERAVAFDRDQAVERYEELYRRCIGAASGPVALRAGNQ
ncbi:MAG: N-acetyl-alpha-D-glucosaminyl L-malate synthase BshA [Planctomycetes bacterium]|nr:N-acetyl-alpha-D-glucosaminyl L-malate synthase BshA [Planctomycetota bacterium]